MYFTFRYTLWYILYKSPFSCSHIVRNISLKISILSTPFFQAFKWFIILLFKILFISIMPWRTDRQKKNPETRLFSLLQGSYFILYNTYIETQIWQCKRYYISLFLNLIVLLITILQNTVKNLISSLYRRIILQNYFAFFGSYFTKSDLQGHRILYKPCM